MSPPGAIEDTAYRTRVSLLLACLILICALLFIANIFLGSVMVPLRDILAVFTGGVTSHPSYELIVGDYRLPKAIAASFAGAGLAVSGLLMQTLFRNPLAGPFILGISSGASLGVAFLLLGSVGLSISLSNVFGEFSLVAAACAGSGLLMGLVLFASQRIQNSVTLLILGLMFGYAAGALVNVLTYFSTAEQIQNFVIWNMGSFSHLNWSRLQVFIPIVAFALSLAFLCAYPLNALMLGENYARSMGMNVKRIRIWVIVATSLLAGAVTSFCGPIAFLGVAVPHVARRLLRRAEHRGLIPVCALCGMAIALLADIIAGVPGHDLSLPLNAITSLIGAPFVIFIIIRRNRGFS